MHRNALSISLEFEYWSDCRVDAHNLMREQTLNETKSIFFHSVDSTV